MTVLPVSDDLLLKIIAQDQYKSDLADAREMVAAMTDEEKRSVQVAGERQQAEQQLRDAIASGGQATQQAAQQLRDLDQQLADGKINSDQYAQGIQEIKAGMTDAESGGRQWIQSLVDVKAAVDLVGQGIQSLKQIWDFSEEGAAINRIGQQFQQVASDFHANGDEMVAAMDKAARGTVDDEQLMQVATRAMTQGTIQNQDQLVKFTEIARASAVRFGGDTASALQSILYATEVGAQRQLKATIGVVDFTKSYEDLAKQLGKRKQDLTDEEQLQARVNAVLDKGSELVKKVGAAGDDALTSMQRLDAKMADLGDTVKGNVATAVDGLLFGQEKLNALMQAHADEVAKTTNNYTDYAAEVARSGQVTGDLTAVTSEARDVTGNIIGTYVTLNDQLYRVNRNINILTESEYKDSKASADLDGAVRALHHSQQQAADSAQQQAEADKQAASAADARAEAMTKFYATSEQNQAVARANLSASMDLALQYTDAENKRADIEKQLLDLDTKIAANGPIRTADMANQKMTADQRALAEQKLKVAQEDVTQIQKKAGETEAEYSLRVSEAKKKVDDLTTSLGTHSVTLGGVTQEQLKQRDALQAQLDEFDKTQEIQRATEVFNAVSEAVKSGALSAEEGGKRLEELNSISHLYSDTALATAKNQLALVAAMTDPNSKDWLNLLVQDQNALNGVSASTEQAAASVVTHVGGAVKSTADTVHGALADMVSGVDTAVGGISSKTEAAMKRAGDSIAERAQQITNSVPTAAEQVIAKAGDSAAERAAQIHTDNITNIVNTALTGAQRQATTSTDQINTHAQNAMNQLRGVANGVSTDIRNTAAEVDSQILSWTQDLNHMPRKIEIELDYKVHVSGDQIPQGATNPPNLPPHQLGAASLAPNAPILAGETGAEMFVPPVMGSLMNSSDTSRLIGMLGNLLQAIQGGALNQRPQMQITNNVSASDAGMAAFNELLRQEMLEPFEMRLGG